MSETLATNKSELDLYLEETKFDHKKELDILAYWRDNCGRYPILSRMTCNLMSIPITRVASKLSKGIVQISKFTSS